MSRGECNVSNVLKYLGKKGFQASRAEALGVALRVPSGRIHDAVSNRSVHGSFQLVLYDIIQYWLDNDLEANWERLARALDDNYCAIAEKIRDSSGQPFELAEIVTALQKNGFPASEGETLAMELGIPSSKLKSLMASRGDVRNVRMALADIIQAWIDNDLTASWETLDKALGEVDPSGITDGACLEERPLCYRETGDNDSTAHHYPDEPTTELAPLII